MPEYVDEQGFLTLSHGPRHGSCGNDFIQAHFRRVEPDIVISMIDTFVLDTKKIAGLPWAAWQVIDSDPLMPELVDPASAATELLAMSRYGKGVLKDKGFDSTYIPLAYNPLEYFECDRDNSRAALGEMWGRDLSGVFVVAMNSANMSKPSRKNFAAAFDAFSRFRACSEAPCLLYCHTELTGQLYNGEDLRKVLAQYGLGPESVVFPDQYSYVMGLIDENYLRNVYNAADVFLHTARGEGFGLPLIEAQACGCPVIAPNATAIPELVHDGALLPAVPFAYHEGTTQYLVHPSDVATALKEAFARGDRNRGAVTDSVKPFEIGRTMAGHMAPFLEYWKREHMTTEKENAA
jgi:glycosyltransferase involved in cell wall biosynthesis